MVCWALLARGDRPADQDLPAARGGVLLTPEGSRAWVRRRRWSALAWAPHGPAHTQQADLAVSTTAFRPSACPAPHGTTATPTLDAPARVPSDRVPRAAFLHR